MKTAATYFIDSGTGNDQNNGTSKKSPWKTLARLSRTRLYPGDSVLFKNGSSFTGPLIVFDSGEPGRYIVLSSYGSKSDPAPAFTNHVFREGNFGNGIRIKGSYVVVENLYFSSTAAYSPVSTDGDGWVEWEMGAIHIDSTAQHCIIRNNEIQDCVAGIRSNGEHTLIEHNYIHDCNRVLKKWNWGPLGIWLGADYQEVRYNRIFNYSAVDPRINWGPDAYGSGADGGALEIDDARHDKAHISIHHNYTRDCQGFLEVTWTDVKQKPVYRNFEIHHNISDDYQQFIALWQGEGCRIENNTIIRRKVNANDWGVFNITQFHARNLIRNNIIITEKNIRIFNLGKRDKAKPLNIISHNLYFAAAGKLNMGLEGPGDSAIFGNPRFENYEKSQSPADFCIDAFSPAIDNGISTGYDYDFVHTAIPQNKKPDIGAFEFQQQNTNTRKISVEENKKSLSTTVMAKPSSHMQENADREIQNYVKRISGAESKIKAAKRERESAIISQEDKSFDQGQRQPLMGGAKLNVIIIFTDDQGYGDFSCHGNPVLKTLALDSLYNQSVRFSNFHVAPLCTPSRGELMSGLDALHNGAFTVGTGRNILRRDILTMPEIFKDNGYQTGLFGKWHLGDNYPDRPMDRGFCKSVWFKGWGLLSEAEYDNDYYQTRYLDSLKTTYSDKYCTDLWFDEAIKWMDEMNNRNQPFFVYLATNAPHGPYYAPKEDFEFYTKRVKDTATAKFFGMIRNLDKNAGRLQKWLEEKNLRNNTIVVYMNDNGGTGGVKVYNAGMRGMKGSSYEGGHRAACFITGPKSVIGAPRTIHFASEIQDLLPTFIDLLDLKVRRHYKFDGYSLKSLFQNKGVPGDRMFVVQYGGNNQQEKYSSCVVWNYWRLVGKNELYNLSKDPGQEHNIASDFPTVLHKMQHFYETWWKKTEQSAHTFIPLIVGTENQNPVILTSDFWADSFYVNTQWKVAQAGGFQKGGVWNIRFSQEGKYQVELSRWPFHLNRELVAAGPPTTIGGTKLRQGKAAAVEFGCFSLDDGKPLITRKTKQDATCIRFQMQMPKGDHTIQAWFRDEDGRDICGAFYLKLTIITDTDNETSKIQTAKAN